MLYHLKYVLYDDKKLAAQEYYKNMTQEERDGEFPEGVTKIARVHNFSKWLWLCNCRCRKS